MALERKNRENYLNHFWIWKWSNWFQFWFFAIFDDFIGIRYVPKIKINFSWALWTVLTKMVCPSMRDSFVVRPWNPNRNIVRKISPIMNHFRIIFNDLHFQNPPFSLVSVSIFSISISLFVKIEIFWEKIQTFSLKIRSSNNKLSFETLFVEIGRELFEIFHLRYHLGFGCAKNAI